jgi:uncharacterized protein (TIGR02271 family)
MTTTHFSAETLGQGVVIGSDGDTIGKVGQVYLDNQTGQPSWVTVKTGWFGTSESFVPLNTATAAGEDITVPYDKAAIKGAPHTDSGHELTEQEEDELYSYYGLDSTGERTATDTTVATGIGTGTPASATTGHDRGEFLTRSEEQLHVGTERVQTGRARLRKFIVTEHQTVTVPVTHEEVRLVREPLTPGDTVDATIGEETTDVVLTQERVLVNKETVPVEKVRLDTETITEQQHVTDSVRKEQIEFDNGTTSRADQTRPTRR